MKQDEQREQLKFVKLQHFLVFDPIIRKTQNRCCRTRDVLKHHVTLLMKFMLYRHVVHGLIRFLAQKPLCLGSEKIVFRLTWYCGGKIVRMFQKKKKKKTRFPVRSRSHKKNMRKYCSCRSICTFIFMFRLWYLPLWANYKLNCLILEKSFYFWWVFILFV